MESTPKSSPGLELERAMGDVTMGVDEAGRGPLAGGVYAAAVSVPLDAAEMLVHGAWAEVNDSKKLSPAKRDALASVIKSTPECTWAVASASPAEIDEFNILHATHIAMRRAALEVGVRFQGRRIGILVDGLPVPSLPFPSRNVIKGDAKSLFIAAASILAKTARDAECAKLDEQYPGYGFAVHKGYPTPAHLKALRELGPCPAHRRSFRPVRQTQMTLWD